MTQEFYTVQNKTKNTIILLTVVLCIVPVSLYCLISYFAKNTFNFNGILSTNIDSIIYIFLLISLISFFLCICCLFLLKIKLSRSESEDIWRVWAVCSTIVIISLSHIASISGLVIFFLSGNSRTNLYFQLLNLTSILIFANIIVKLIGRTPNKFARKLTEEQPCGNYQQERPSLPQIPPAIPDK